MLQRGPRRRAEVTVPPARRGQRLTDGRSPSTPRSRRSGSAPVGAGAMPRGRSPSSGRTSSTTAWSASTIAADGTLSVRARPGRRPRGPRPGRRRQPAAAAPRPAQPVGRLGHRPALPRTASRPDRRRVGHRRRERTAARRRAGRARLRQGLAHRPDASPCRAGSRRVDVGPRSTGTSARRSSRRPGRSTCTPTESTRGDPVRPRPPAHPREHQLGRGPLRGVRPPLGARRASPATASRVINDSTYGHDVAPRHPDGRRHDHHGPARPAARTARAPTRRPTRAAPLHLRAAAGRERRGRDRGGLRAQPAAAGRRRRGRAATAGHHRQPGRRGRGGQARRRPLRRCGRTALRVASVAVPRRPCARASRWPAPR